MGANHTFAFNTEGYGVNAEPGSGSTVMGYAGITGPDDVQQHSDPYFHYHSIKQILDNLVNRLDLDAIFIKPIQRAKTGNICNINSKLFLLLSIIVLLMTFILLVNRPNTIPHNIKPIHIILTIK